MMHGQKNINFKFFLDELKIMLLNCFLYNNIVVVLNATRLDINLLKPNDIYICRTAALTSRRYILNIYSTNIHTEYFKHAAYAPFFLFKMPFIS